MNETKTAEEVKTGYRPRIRRPAKPGNRLKRIRDRIWRRKNKFKRRIQQRKYRQKNRAKLKRMQKMYRMRKK